MEPPLSFFFKFQRISDKILWAFEKVLLKFPLSPYRMLRTHKIAWRKLRSLFLNIVKTRKGREKQNCPNSTFSYNFFPSLSGKCAKFEVQYFRVAHFESNSINRCRFPCQTLFLQAFLMNKKMTTVNQLFNKKFIMYIELFVKKVS